MLQGKVIKLNKALSFVEIRIRIKMCDITPNECHCNMSSADVIRSDPKRLLIKKIAFKTDHSIRCKWTGDFNYQLLCNDEDGDSVDGSSSSTDLVIAMLIILCVVVIFIACYLYKQRNVARYEKQRYEKEIQELKNTVPNKPEGANNQPKDDITEDRINNGTSNV